jgi:hypothetical protein
LPSLIPNLDPDSQTQLTPDLIRIWIQITEHNSSSESTSHSLNGTVYDLSYTPLRFSMAGTAVPLKEACRWYMRSEACGRATAWGFSTRWSGGGEDGLKVCGSRIRSVIVPCLQRNFFVMQSQYTRSTAIPVGLC